MDNDQIKPPRQSNRPGQPGEAERAALFARTASGARRLASRLEADPATMAWVLASYREAEDQDDTLLAHTLGVDVDRLPHLALCNRPREELFRADVETIAAHIGMDPLALADVVRRVDALTGFGQRAGGRRGGIVAAARDRAAEDPAAYDPGELPPAADAPPAGPSTKDAQ